MTTNILVAHYSTYGNNAAMAHAAVDALVDAGHNVRHRRFAETAPDSVVQSQEAWAQSAQRQQSIPVITGEDIVWANGVLFSIPTRFGSAPSQVRSFLTPSAGCGRKASWPTRPSRP